MAGASVVRSEGEGTALWMLGGLYEVKVSSEESNGELTVMEMTMPPGMGPPPHTHAEGETVRVLDGTLRYHIGGESFEGGPGTTFHIPAGTVENFEPTGDKPLRVLVVYTPGGIDQFFSEAGEPAQSREIPPPPESPPDVERLAQIGARYGLDIKAPTES
jgi:quercetin dioxygenase-like cupin family protein